MITKFTRDEGAENMRAKLRFYQVIRRDGLTEVFGAEALKGYGLIEASGQRITRLLRDRSPLLR